MVTFVAAGATVTFMLRRTSVFDEDESLRPFISSGKARLVSGDGLKKDDVQKAYAFAAEVGKVDLVLFTIGM